MTHLEGRPLFKNPENLTVVVSRHYSGNQLTSLCACIKEDDRGPRGHPSGMSEARFDGNPDSCGNSKVCACRAPEFLTLLL